MRLKHPLASRTNNTPRLDDTQLVHLITHQPAPINERPYRSPITDLDHKPTGGTR